MSLKSDKNNGYLREDVCNCMIIFVRILLRMRNVLDKICRKSKHTYGTFSNFFFSENLAVYELMWTKYRRSGHATDDSVKRPKATDTHSEYVIPLAFPRQQWLCAHSRELRYVYIARLVSPFTLYKTIKQRLTLANVTCFTATYRMMQSDV